MNQKREVQSDLVRVIAMIFVIAVHTPLGEMSSIWWFNYFTRTLFFTCNGMFYMLSGKYNLRFCANEESRREAYGTYYYKKFVNIILPFVLYSLLLYLYSVRNDLLTMSFGDILQGFWNAVFCVNNATHLWFMYPLIGMLLSAPIIAKALNAMSDFELKIVVLIGTIWQIVGILLFKDVLGYSFAFSGWIFDGWIFYFVLGYCCDRLFTASGAKIMVMLGVIASIITTLQKQFLPEHSENIWDLSPVYTLVIVGVYLFFERICVVKNAIVKRIIMFLAKYSFAVYIVHYAVKDFCCGERFDSILTSLGPLAIWLLRVIFIFLISLLLGIIIETIIMDPIKKIMKGKV